MKSDKTKKLIMVAREKESVRSKLAVTAKEKEVVRRKLVVTAKGKEDARNKLVVTAKRLAATAKEAEGIRSKLVVTAKKLAATAKEKETVRRKLVVTAKKLAATAKEAEGIRSKLVVTAKKLAATAKEKETVRRKLVVTAKEKEDTRNKLVVTAKRLAATAKEAEEIRSKLAVTAKKLAATAKEKETVRRKLVVTAQKLAATAKKTKLINEELRQIDIAKDEFVSIASHQLRTPLTALKGYTGMLLDGDAGLVNAKQHEYLTEIKNANDRMINLITALLNVSRVDLDVFIVEPEPVDFKKVAADILKELQIKIKEKKLLVATDFGKDIPTISADLNIVRMVFQNLLTNALKYTAPGGKINISIKKDGANIFISVADTGYGIPKNVQSKIFTKMFRADNARVKDPDGTGLGLYIIKSTLEKTGGKIWFESAENKGSTFYVTTPIKGMKKKEGTKRLELK